MVYFCPTFSFCFPTFFLVSIFEVLVFLLFHIAVLDSLYLTFLCLSPGSVDVEVNEHDAQD